MLELCYTHDCYRQPQTLPDLFVPISPGMVRRLAKEELFTPHPRAPLIRSAAAVGAFYAPGIGLSPNDEALMASALLCAKQEGFAIAQDFRIAAANLINGVDVLESATRLRADLFVSCLVYDPPQEEPVGVHEANTSKRTSPHHRIPGIWGKAAAQMGARAVVLFYAQNQPLELMPRHFEGSPYVKRQSTLIDATYANMPIQLYRDLLVHNGLS